MPELKKALTARDTVKGTGATPSQSDNDIKPYHFDQAHGLSIAAQILASEYGDDPTNPKFLDLIEGLHDYANGEGDEGRSYAAAPAPRQGMQLVASKKNPRVRRWVKISAMQHAMGQNIKQATTTSAGLVGGAIAHAVVGQYVGNKLGQTHTHVQTAVGRASTSVAHSTGLNTASMLVDSLHRAVERSSNLDADHLNALSHQHYLAHHAPLVAAIARTHNVSQDAAARALAHAAHGIHVSQFGLGRGKGASRVSDANYHKALGFLAARKALHYMEKNK